jgi:hypothetical protein
MIFWGSKALLDQWITAGKLVLVIDGANLSLDYSNKDKLVMTHRKNPIDPYHLLSWRWAHRVFNKGAL